MEFHRAIQLARSNPGTIPARDHDGSFIVRNPDGTLVTDGTHDGSSDDSTNTLGHLEDTIRDLRSKLHQQEATNSSLDEELKVTKIRFEEKFEQHRLEYEEKIQNLRSNIKKLQDSNATLKKELHFSKSQLEILANKYGMVSMEEMKRIENQQLEERRNERHTIRCSCLGEVENCHFCHGRGTYVTDGFGNKV